MEYKIEKNIPILRKYHKSKYPFLKMGIGDSFIVKNKNIANSVITIISVYNNKNNKNLKFTTKRISEYEYRIWRIK